MAGRSTWPFVATGGLVLALSIALSPVTVVSTAALAVIVWVAVRDLSGAERQVVLWVLVSAIVVRVVAILAIFVSAPSHHLVSLPFDGDGLYMKSRSIWIRNVWLGVPIDSQHFKYAFEGYGWSSYIYIIAYLQYLLAPAPYAIHLFNVCCYVGAAVVLFRIMRAAHDRLAAVIALAVILYLPTLFMWSVSALKESLYLLLLTTVLVGLLMAVRSNRLPARALGAGVLVASVMALSTIRVGASLIVAAALGLAWLGTYMTRRYWVLGFALLILPLVTVRLLERPSVQTHIMARVLPSAGRHLGNVHTTGHGYKLLDDRFYSGDRLDTMTWEEGERFLLRAAYSFVVVPWPWQLASTSELMFLPQQLIWYGLIVLALIGVREGCRGDVFVTWLFTGMACAGAAVIAPNEGNIGTMVRHRDGIIPFVVCLSALGASSLLAATPLFGAIRRRHLRDTAAGPLSIVSPDRLLARMLESSVVVTSVRKLARGSVICRSMAAVLRPSTILGRDPVRVEINQQFDAALVRVASSSALVSGLAAAVRTLVSAWRGSFVAAVVQPVMDLAAAGRLRVLGTTLFVGVIGGGALAAAGDEAWPSVWAWAIAAALSLLLVIASRSLGAESRVVGKELAPTSSGRR